MRRFDEHCHRVLSELVEAGRVLDEYEPELGDILRAETVRLEARLRELRRLVNERHPDHEPEGRTSSGP